MNRPTAREKDYFFQKTYFYFLKLNLRAKKQPKSLFSKFTPKITYFFRFMVFKYFSLLNPKKNNAFSKKMSKFPLFFLLFFSIFSVLIYFFSSIFFSKSNKFAYFCQIYWLLCQKKIPRPPKFEKKVKNIEILTFFLKIRLKKLELIKKIKFKSKKLKKYVIFGINLKKTLFEHFLALQSNFTKEKYIFFKSRLFL